MKTIVLDYRDGFWWFQFFDQPGLRYDALIQMEKWLDNLELQDSDLRICWPVGMMDPYILNSKGKAEIVLGEKIGFLLTQNPVREIKSITLDSKELPKPMIAKLLPNDSHYHWY